MNQITADKLGILAVIELRNAIAIPHGTLKAKWAELGLPLSALPKPRTSRDAFRKATPKNKATNGLQLEEYKGVAARKEGLDIAVVMTLVSDAKTRISKRHRNLLVIGLTEPGELVVRGEAKTAAQAAYLEQIRSVFHDLTNGEIIDGRDLQRAIKHAAEGLHAFAIKGGVYMVPGPHVAEGAALVELATYLNAFLPQGTKSNIAAIVNYANDPLHRDQLKQLLDTHVKETLEQQLLDLRKREKIGPAAEEFAFARIADLGSTIAEYERVLGESLDDLHATQDLYRSLLRQELARL